MNLIVISPSNNLENETEIVKQLFEHGLEIFHLRKPRMSTREMTEYIEAIPKHFHNRIVVHSHHKLAARYKLRGIHLTKYHRRNMKSLGMRLRLWWLRMQRREITISTSYHKLAGIYEDTGDFSYVLLSPIFETLTGNYHSGFSEHSLRTALEKNPVKVYARGGTGLSSIGKVKSLGFTGAALQSAIWKSDKPLEAFISILDASRENAGQDSVAHSG